MADQADGWDEWSDDGGRDDGALMAPSPPTPPVEVDEARIVHFEEQIKVSLHTN